jgi:hypothetical protein
MLKPGYARWPLGEPPITCGSTALGMGRRVARADLQVSGRPR